MVCPYSSSLYFYSPSGGFVWCVCMWRYYDEKGWAVVFDGWLNRLGGIGERTRVGIAVFFYFIFYCFEIGLLIFSLALVFVIFPFLAPIFLFELFGLKFFVFCLKLFPHIHSPRYIIFFHFLIRIYTCGGLPRLVPVSFAAAFLSVFCFIVFCLQRFLSSVLFFSTFDSIFCKFV